MDTQRLRYFLEVARRKNFTRAAELCFVSQPSLSQQIKKLEDEVGGELFHRNRGEVSLSTLGQRFLKHAEAVMAEVATAHEFIAQHQDRAGRTLRFGALPTIAPYWIPDIFQTLLCAHPDARFELVEEQTESLIERLRTGLIDFALLSPPTLIDNDSESLLLAEDALLLTLPLGHPLGGKETVTFDDLRDERLLLLEDSHCLSRQTSALCREAGLSSNPGLRCSQIDTLLHLVERGFGIAFTPAVAAQANAHRKLLFRALPGNHFSRELRLLWMPRKVMPRMQELALERLRRPDWQGELGTVASRPV